ncbi:MAG: ABC transporter ATP-binding protein [Myxococcota bacterium]
MALASAAEGRYHPAMNSLRRLFAYSRAWKARYALATTYAVVNKLFDIAPEILIGVAVDVVVQREESFLADLGLIGLELQLVVLGFLTVVIWAGESIFQYLYELEWRNLAQALQHKARSDVYDHVQNLRMSELESRRQGEIQTILTEDVNQLERFLNSGLVAIIHVVTSTVAVSAVFLALAPTVAGFAMLPIPIIVATAFWFQRGLSRRYASVRESAGRLGARLTSQLRGLATIKSYTAQSRALEALNKDSLGYESTNRSAIRLSSAFVPVIRMAILSGFVVTLVYGGFRTLEGSLAVGAYSVLVFLTQRLLWPFTRLGETVDLYQRSMASADRVLDLLELQREVDRDTSSAEGRVYRGSITLDRISFAYQGRDKVLDEVSLQIGAESFVGLIGATGSGKSTLVKLLMRFYEPDSGEISIGGRLISTLPLTELRSHIGWVSQDVFLFHGSIHENIALGRPEASREAVIEASTLAELHDFVSTLPRGYNSAVGDFGMSLSGGQRQRLAIARAVLKDPSILILDEATSAVDNETEAAIQRSLARVSQGRTVIAVAHRLSTVRNADAIVVLENGRIVELGDHQSLLERDGRYARLWAMQIGKERSTSIPMG